MMKLNASEVQLTCKCGKGMVVNRKSYAGNIDDYRCIACTKRDQWSESTGRPIRLRAPRPVTSRSRRSASNPITLMVDDNIYKMFYDLAQARQLSGAELVRRLIAEEFNRRKEPES